MDMFVFVMAFKAYNIEFSSLRWKSSYTRSSNRQIDLQKVGIVSLILNLLQRLIIYLYKQLHVTTSNSIHKEYA